LTARTGAEWFERTTRSIHELPRVALNIENAMNEVELVFRSLGLEYEKEKRFHPVRRWRFDYFLPALNTAIEIEGGIFSGGRHTRGAGYSRDCEKYNQAQIMGFLVLRYPAHELRKSCAGLIEDLEKITGIGQKKFGVEVGEWYTLKYDEKKQIFTMKNNWWKKRGEKNEP